MRASTLKEPLRYTCSPSRLHHCHAKLRNEIARMQRGFPPPEDESDVGRPREQWEASLRSYDRWAWYEYRNERCRELGSM